MNIKKILIFHNHHKNQIKSSPNFTFQISRRSLFLTTTLSTIILNTKSTTAKQLPYDWTSPGLAVLSPEENEQPEFFSTKKGIKIQELNKGKGNIAKLDDIVEIDYVCRRSNGYFIYSTVEGISFQPRDVPTEPFTFKLGDPNVIEGLQDAIIGMKEGGRRRVLIPPNLGYIEKDMEPQPPTFAAKRQIINHSKEPLLFEIELFKIKQI